jgi:hypothetical protein
MRVFAEVECGDASATGSARDRPAERRLARRTTAERKRDGGLAWIVLNRHSQTVRKGGCVMQQDSQAIMVARSPTRGSSVKYGIGFVLLAAIVGAVFYFSIYRSYIGAHKIDTAEAFILMLLALAIGDFVSVKTKALIPSIFVTAALFIVGFWTVFPKNILELGGIAPNLPGFFVMMMVTHLGTMLNKDELIAQWKTVLVTIAGMLGIILAVMTIGRMLVGTDIAATATPPLTGGLVSAIIMQNAVKANDYLVIIAMAMYVLQGFVGFPLINYCLRIEGQDMLRRFRAGEISLESVKAKKKADIETGLGVGGDTDKYRIFPATPKEYQTDFVILLKTVVLVIVSGYLEPLTGGTVSKFVFALVLGVAAAETGFIERKPLDLSRSFGLFLTIIMMFVFSGLKSVTLEMLQKILLDYAILISLSTIGIAALSIPLGKMIGLSKAMSFAIGLGTIAGGFPASYVLSNESAKLQSANEQEYEFLLEHFLPKTLVSGFVSATSGSVIIAGLFAKIYFG